MSVGQIVTDLWNSTIYTNIQEIGGTLAIATFVCSAFYFFIIGRSKNGLELAKALMIGAGVGIIIIYIGPAVIRVIIDAVSGYANKINP